MLSSDFEERGRIDFGHGKLVVETIWVRWGWYRRPLVERRDKDTLVVKSKVYTL